ncbi:hypothetical protein SAY87_016502 [Trapa incisa]|uniref:RBR-type E3 ubiquitin transferase n=1 Tax=Trapa incisa TaxID=236973 RepID=A0AAN7LH22_9MYRT|nr:hypothetical protein SAY87_016502 [Trapa incisa]
MPDMAAYGHFPHQQVEGEEGDFGISALFLDDDHEVEKAAEPAISSDSEDKNVLQHQEVPEDSSSSPISQEETCLPMEHCHPKTQGSNLDEGAGSSSTRDGHNGFCGICLEKKQMTEMIRVNKICSHSFCSNCISNHVRIRVAGNQATIPCLEFQCEHSVEFQSCMGILPRDVLDAWDRNLCEALILDAHKFYCPFRDCSAMLVNDSEMLFECECPHCNRLFCAQCLVPWHSGVSCKEFQELSEDERESQDLMLMILAQEQKWARCPKCKFYVEKTMGCQHMTCRCGYEFCYGCGSQWSQSHGSCSGN